MEPTPEIPILILPETVNAPDHPHQPVSDIGVLGETLVAEWLQLQGAIVLHHRWTCRYGELDLVVQTPDSVLAFVEVKTRSQRNWDSNGLLAITPAKQKKILKTAELFLVNHPHLEAFPCRFDVALVRSQAKKRSQPKSATSPTHFTKTMAGYQFTLQDYIPNAFD